MSNTPGISPITTDIKDIIHSDEDGFFGDEGKRIHKDEDSEESHGGDDNDGSSPER